MRWITTGLLIASSLVPATCFAGSGEELLAISRQIDQVVAQGCSTQGVTSLGRCNDAEFLRRVWLDLAGRTPPVAEIVKRTAAGPLDRQRIVIELLQTPEFAKHWGRVWTEYLTDRRPFDEEEYDARRLRHYLTDAFRENLSYDRLVTELIVGEGTSDSSGPANFLLRYNAEPVPLAGAVSQKFLGVSLQCAECHDHPHATWTQQDFWGLAAHFARLRKMTPAKEQEGENFYVVIERPRGELTVPDKQAPPDENGDHPSKTIFPQLPGDQQSETRKPRRAVLVAWMTKPENPYLSRHLINTVWERLLGARLVRNLDDWPRNSATTETALLNLLAADFVSGGFNVQRLLETITLSETYQRASHAEMRLPSATEQRRADGEVVLWARARIRPLSADQIHLSIAQAFGYHYDENDFRLAEATDEEFTYDLPRESFGSIPLSLGRSLALYNSEHIRGAVELGAEALVRLYGPSAGTEHIDRLFLALLARRPSIRELQLFQELGGKGDARQGLQDVAWVLLNSAEFVTNH